MLSRVVCLLVLTIGAVGVVGENPATIKTQSDGHELVMNVGGAQLLLRSNNDSGAVACSGPEVEIVNGQCVARKDTLTKEIIKIYLDTLMLPVQSSIDTLKTGLTNVVDEVSNVEDRVTDLESFSKGNASVITAELIPQIAKLTSDTVTLSKTAQTTQQLIGDTTKKLNTSIQTHGERIDWLNSFSQYKDETSFIVGGSSNAFYPVVFPLGLSPTKNGIEHKLVIYRQYAEKAPKGDAKWGNSNSHFGMQYTEIDALHNLWGGAPRTIQMKRNIYQYSQPFGGVEFSQPDGSALVVYLRGGGAIYHVWADMPVHSDNKAWCVPLMTTTKIYDSTDDRHDRSVGPKQMTPYRWCNPVGVSGGC